LSHMMKHSWHMIGS